MADKIYKLLVSLVVTFAAAAVGSLATYSKIPTWYAELNRPSFAPPNFLFGPVWTLLYTLMAIGLWQIWTAPGYMEKRRAYVAFGVQLALNALWSLVFFGAEQLWLAVGVIVLLLVAIVWMQYEFYKIKPLAAYLQIPYAAWVSFATVLNIGFALLNG